MKINKVNKNSSFIKRRLVFYTFAVFLIVLPFSSFGTAANKANSVILHWRNIALTCVQCHRNKELIIRLAPILS